MPEVCPICGGRAESISASYPPAFECKECGFVFIKPPRALVEE